MNPPSEPNDNSSSRVLKVKIIPDEKEPKMQELNEKTVPALEIYKALMALYIQRDTLSWSRLQTLGAVELATLAAFFAMRESGWEYPLIFGTIIVFLIGLMMLRDRQCRKHTRDDLDKVHKMRELKLSPEGGLKCLLKFCSKWKEVGFGGIIMLVVVVVLFVINGLLFIPGIRNSIFSSQHGGLKTPSTRRVEAATIQIRTPERLLLSYPVESDKNVRIEFNGTNVVFTAKKQ